MMTQKFLLTLLLLAASIIPSAALKATNEESKSKDIAQLIQTYLKADSTLKARIARQSLLSAGSEHHKAVREASEKVKSSHKDKAQGLKEISVKLLSQELTKVIEKKLATGLVFDGQYDAFKEIPGALEALHSLLDDETVDIRVRMGSINALADVADEKFKPRLEALIDDPFLYPLIREELGILLAILGDTRKVDNDIKKLKEHVNSRNPDLSLNANLQLANLSYRIRKYGQAIECYKRILGIYQLVRTRFPKDHPLVKVNFNDRALALQHYNTACSYSLNKEIKEAREHLKKSILLDSTHFKNMSIDGDLKNLRDAKGHKEYKQGITRALQDEEI